MNNKYTNLIIVTIFILINVQKVFTQDTTCTLLKCITGSGGIFYSQNSQYHHSATAGESILGFAQTENFILRSGFWIFPQFGPTAVNDKNQYLTPASYQLYQNYPNPFNPSTTIKYDVPEPSVVRIEIFNILGERIFILINSEIKNAGFHKVSWNGSDTYGNNVSSGIYFYRIDAKSEINKQTIFRDLKKMIFLK
jgi:hypothetical protein